MAILTLNDALIYAPAIPVSNTLFAEALLLRCQGLAESPLGANRPLEITEYEEERELTISAVNHEFNLYRSPVLLAPPPILQTQVGINNWANMNDDNYHVKKDGYCRVSLLMNASFSFGHSLTTRIRALYSAGFDFTQADPDVLLIKSIVGQLAQTLFLAEGGMSQLSPESYTSTQIEEFESKDDSRFKKSKTALDHSAIAMAAGDKLNVAIKNILYPLKKYAPRFVAVT